ncbi:AGE family epimerase/isomerase [Thalassomonas haliotis]|uniref:Cellobiose 2-epimerase n=1 Tax=Thalassomonas haliotis TaxID=485448 RepID=A0ABY7VCC0_9GAMM|nr:AGE family epimerase/isomerase [Thalassomonas haliotis]WDE11047.1 AGE family epimerase/isomerase [Thalassomonas haliotis]
MTASAVPITSVSAGEFYRELKNISSWWQQHAVDKQYGGFVGEIDHLGKVVDNADKGIILNTRLLWFFSEAALFFRDELKDDVQQDKCAALAGRAFYYLLECFDDPQHGGVFWSLDYKGRLFDGKKQTYALAFAIYGLCAYYKLTRESQALAKAMGYFQLLESRALDTVNGGYCEAFAADWSPLQDMRLSNKDDNLPKTMNTHLHVLEAYTALYSANPTPATREALARNIRYFSEHIINPDNGHLRLFMEMDWQDKSRHYSFGHDIEGSWLLYEALQVLAEPELLAGLTPLVIKLARTCLREGLSQGLSDNGRVLEAYDFIEKEIDPCSDWWVQAEAMVGFLNAYQLTQDTEYIKAFEGIWHFTRQQHLDRENGEWHWLALEDQASKPARYKAGFWKAPYHNGRAMMEICRLLAAMPAKEQAAGRGQLVGASI